MIDLLLLTSTFSCCKVVSLCQLPSNSENQRNRTAADGEEFYSEIPVAN